MAAGKFCGKARGDDAWRLASFLAISTVVLFVATGFAAAVESEAEGRVDGELEQLLLRGLELIGQNRIDEARTSIQTLLKRRPDFRLANAIFGDLLMAGAGKVTRFGEGVVGNEKELADLLAEAKVRLASENRPPTSALPGGLLRLPLRYKHALIVDLSRSRLYLFRNRQGVPEPVSDYYITIGKAGAGKKSEGDKKTPIGLYHVTGHLGGKSLPPFYGAGALPLDYPNAWDQLHRRTGGGIWLHGSPSGLYSRPPRASDGCVVLTNPDFKILEKSTPEGTPVMLTQHVDWLPPEEWQQRREKILQRISQWRDAWVKRKGEGVLHYYSAHYRTGRMDDGAWNRLLAGEDGLMDPGLMEYPGDDGMMVVTWSGWQASGTGGNLVPMVQYWRFEEGADWKIVFEPNG
ncbi:MAG: YkuD protein [Magnetococcales bacterium]|nr:YkuD protein [Magnetococcales bacterium]HIJ82654.1 L,D-transpeptidase family protein [Magnetococcales bacterium]